MIKRSNNPFDKAQDKQSGQVLLIIVMILATILAVTFSISFTSQTEIKTSKLEEDSKRALAAAEAALETSLKSAVGTTNTLNIGGITAYATPEAIQSSAFVTPLIQKDEQYSFYLSDYNNQTNTFSNPFSGDVYIYMKSESGCPALELTYLDTANPPVLSRDLIDPCDQKTGGNNLLSAQSGSFTINSVNFGYRLLTPKTLTLKKLMFMRVLFNATKLGIQEVSGSINFPAQGKTTTAQAQTGSSVFSSVTLFQSYPQIPSDFFVSSF
jgi:hypothetical protein